jgi:hypothetical protein
LQRGRSGGSVCRIYPIDVIVKLELMTMSNLIPLDKAAQMLGIDAKALNGLRLQNRIQGVRDGAVWKFKLDELQRYAEDHNLKFSESGGPAAKAEGVGDELDFELSSGTLKLDDSGDDFIMKDSDSVDLSEDLKDSSELSFGSSDIALATGDDKVLGDEEQKSGPSDTMQLLAGTGAGPEDQMIDERKAMADDSVEMDSDFEDSDLVLDDSDSSNKVSLEANDSGINLSPTDSGISLEEQPLELGGSDIDSLELPDDEDAIALNQAADLDSPTELRAEDDFNLTPSFDSGEDESSGSQVIALEDSELFADDSAPTILSESDVAQQPQLLAEEPGEGHAVYTGAVAVTPEVPLKIWEVCMLGVTAAMTLLCFMVAFDLARHIWQGPDSTNRLTSTVMDFFVGRLGR